MPEFAHDEAQARIEGGGKPCQPIGQHEPRKPARMFREPAPEDGRDIRKGKRLSRNQETLACRCGNA